MVVCNEMNELEPGDNMQNCWISSIEDSEQLWLVVICLDMLPIEIWLEAFRIGLEAIKEPG